jgi:UV DNA damage endonuclease
MRIGYPCINLSLGCRSSRTFRLRNYSPERLRETVSGNLDCLRRTLLWNRERGILYFRITSDLVPFASHPVMDFPWQEAFREDLASLGRLIKRHRMRVTMHPDQFVLLNTPDRRVLENSLGELSYHAELLDLIGADLTCKIQLHLGGVYGDREAAMERFVERYRRLPGAVRRRLVLENDERCYGLAECLEVSSRCGVPVVFDVLHHRGRNRGETVREALEKAASTWGGRHGPPMVDYSSQKPGGRPGAHAETLDRADFRSFLRQARGLDLDLMLEVKDKERSALEALALLKGEEDG